MNLASGKRILITGANGLIGHELIKLLSGNNNIFAISSFKPEKENSNITRIHIDFNQDWDISSLPGKIDIVYHLAQSEHFRDFPARASDIFSVNVGSTAKLLDYAGKAECKQFVYASSGGVYGNSNEEFTEENKVTDSGDLGFYLSTKLCSEILAENYTNLFDVQIMRFFFAFGPRQRKDMLIPRLVESIKNKIAVKLQGKDGIKINPVFVSDAAVAIASLQTLKGSHKFNIAGKEIITLKKIAETIGEKLGVDVNFDITDTEPKHLIADISKMKNHLVAPQLSFADGVDQLIKSI